MVGLMTPVSRIAVSPGTPIPRLGSAINPGSSRTVPAQRARRLCTTAVAVVTLLATSSCEKPTPLVTVHSGSSVAQSEPQVWCHPGQKFTAGNCAGDKTAPAKVVRVSGNNSVGVDVAAEVAEHGWYVATDKNRSDIQHELFYRLPLGLQTQGPLNIRVVALDRNRQARGLWLFTLVPR